MCKMIAHVTAAPTSISLTLVDAFILSYQKAMSDIVNRSAISRTQLVLGTLRAAVCDSCLYSEMDEANFDSSRQNRHERCFQ
jgi:hypothetical protein